MVRRQAARISGEQHVFRARDAVNAVVSGRLLPWIARLARADEVPTAGVTPPPRHTRLTMSAKIESRGRRLDITEATRPVTERMPAPTNRRRRDFLYIATAAVGTVGAAATLVPLIDQMEPDRATIAAGAPIEFDISKLQPGQQVIHPRWRGKPILVVNRTAGDAMRRCRAIPGGQPAERPGFRGDQQPPYAENWHRSVKPEHAVMVGICTHLGCLPKYYRKPEPTTPADRTGRAAISARATDRNTIWPAGSSPACRRPKPAGAALSLRRCPDVAHRREPAGPDLRPQRGRAALAC